MHNSIHLGNRPIGPDHAPFVVAEAAVNHQGDIAVAKHMVHVAHAVGVDAIKFQMHVLEDEMLRETPRSDNFAKPLFDTLEETNLSLEKHEELMALCSDLGIGYLCTPFSRTATDILDELGVTAFKVGSGELTNLPLQEHIASKGRPMIVSTGMATVPEIKETVDLVKSMGTPLMLTHCVSAYPAPYERVNLGMIRLYEEEFGIPVGLSDHSRGIYTSLGAVALGACFIEKHFTLDKLQSGPDHASSLEPFELSELVKGTAAVYLARGSEKRIFPEEEQIVAWARESVVSR
jgi:N-acetylneuraminate synthase